MGRSALAERPSGGDGAAVSTGRMPRPPARLARPPFARGLAKLAVSLAPLLSRKGAARRGERLFLLAVLLAPLPLAAVPGAYRTVALAVSIVAVLAWMLRGRTLRLHGAEHRAIAAAEKRQLVATWHGVARPSRLRSVSSSMTRPVRGLLPAAPVAAVDAARRGQAVLPDGVARRQVFRMAMSTGSRKRR